jgi:hypothetical protein
MLGLKAKEDFIARYIPAFLAAMAAQDYVRNCQRGWSPKYDPPVDDAMFLAEEAWEQFDKELG